jgi:hypothetical protein
MRFLFLLGSCGHHEISVEDSQIFANVSCDTQSNVHLYDFLVGKSHFIHHLKGIGINLSFDTRELQRLLHLSVSRSPKF